MSSIFKAVMSPPTVIDDIMQENLYTEYIAIQNGFKRPFEIQKKNDHKT